MEESASLGKEASRPSIRDRGMGRKCRERTALPPRVQIEAARTTCKGEGELMNQRRRMLVLEGRTMLSGAVGIYSDLISGRDDFLSMSSMQADYLMSLRLPN